MPSEGLEDIGGCFVKFGQILSLQIDSLHAASTTMRPAPPANRVHSDRR